MTHFRREKKRGEFLQWLAFKRKIWSTLESQTALEGSGGCCAPREIGGNFLGFFMWKRGETRLKYIVPAGIFSPVDMDSKIGRILKRLVHEIPWSHLVLWMQESYAYAFHVHSHEIQQWTLKAQNKIKAMYVPHQSGMFKSYFFPAVFSCFCNLLPSVNSNSLSPGLKMWERLKPKHDASSVLPQAARFWYWMVLSLWSLLWVWEQQLWEKTSPLY